MHRQQKAAPFAWDSGTSVHSGNKVSHQANKEMKRLLHMAAVSVLTKKTANFANIMTAKSPTAKTKCLLSTFCWQS
ncbi:MAG: transposase [Rikenellaceae bacterium]|nr:transposase [Rikenellaceae bacterium]